MNRLLSLWAVLALPVWISTGMAQPNTSGPEGVVQSLYQTNETAASPFFQTQSRAKVDKFFAKDLADLIWKDAVSAGGDLGALDYNPLYGSQDPQITDFRIGAATPAKPDSTAGVVRVSFRDSGKKTAVTFRLSRDDSGTWKITDMVYPDGSSLRKTVGGK